MERIDNDVKEILAKNLQMAEEKLNTAPIDKVDEYLTNFLNAKEQYVTFLRGTNR